MINPFRTQFFAVFQNEVLLNSKRIAPYVLMLFSVFNAVLWSAGLAKGFRVGGRLGSTGWALVITVLSLAVAVVAGSMIK